MKISFKIPYSKTKNIFFSFSIARQNSISDEKCTIKPTFIIIGVQKGGTSSLFNYLNKHPFLSGADKKEIHFFDTDNYNKGIGWYHKWFPKYNNKNDNIITFEASPSYIVKEETAKRLYEYNSKLKLIVILRNPIERAFSAWKMYKWMCTDKKIIDNLIKSEKLGSGVIKYFFNKYYSFPTFETIVKNDIEEILNGKINNTMNIIERGMYVKQIKNYFKYFSKDQFLFLNIEDLRNEPNLTLNKVTTFLNISDFNSNIDISKKHNQSKIQVDFSIDSKVLVELIDFYNDCNKELFNITGIKYNFDLFF